MSNLKSALIIELLWTQSSRHGGAVSPQTKLLDPKLKYEIRGVLYRS